jgi:hypothetical protein
VTTGADAHPASVADEARRLLEALDEHVPDWLRQELPDLRASLTAAVAALGASAGHVRHVVDDSLATGSPECRLCPLCRLIALVRDRDDAQTRRLGEALGTVGAVVLGLLDTMLDDRRRHAATSEGAPVEHIDIG